MLTSGFNAGTSVNADSLLALLSDSKKTAEALKKLKTEQDKLQKLKKEVLEGKTLTAYKKKIEQETADILANKDKELKEVADKTTEHAKEAAKKLKAVQASIRKLEAKEKSIAAQEKELNSLRVAVEVKTAKALEKQEKADKELEYAISLKEEYNTKLADIKERLRGL